MTRSIKGAYQYMWRIRLTSGNIQSKIPSRTLPHCSACLLNKPDENMDGLQKNPYYAKYAEKLKHLQQETPEEFDSKLAALEEAKQKEKEQKRTDVEEQRKEILKKQTSGLSKRASKNLGDIMKLELLKDKSPKEVEQIWQKYHIQKDGVFGVIPAEEYECIRTKGEQFPTFLYPLPRESGYEFVMAQFSGDECHFTPLIAYQTHKDNAAACLSVIHYTELQLEKGIVLMAGDVDPNIISKEDAVMLIKQLQMYYGPKSGKRFELVKKLNQNPDQFKHMDLIEEFKKLTSGK